MQFHLHCSLTVVQSETPGSTSDVIDPHRNVGFCRRFAGRRLTQPGVFEDGSICHV